MEFFNNILPCPETEDDGGLTQKELDVLLGRIWSIQVGLQEAFHITSADLKHRFVGFIREVFDYPKLTEEIVQQFFIPVFPPTAHTWEAYMTARLLTVFLMMMVEDHGGLDSDFFRTFEAASLGPALNHDHSANVLFTECLKSQEAGSDEAEECPICLDPLRQGISTLTCFHRFHAECIDHWLGENTTCPMCRQSADCACLRCFIDTRLVPFWPGFVDILSNDECKICQKRPNAGETVIFLDCGHWYCYGGCVGAFLRNFDDCPTCYLESHRDDRAT